MNEALLPHVVAIAAAYISRNSLAVDQIPDLLGAITTGLETAVAPPAEEKVYEPAVSVRSSVKRDHLVSLIDGKPYKMLKRHLKTQGLTPEEYRARYKLPADYPMTAPAYSERRRELAKSIGLGRHPQSHRRKKAA